MNAFHRLFFFYFVLVILFLGSCVPSVDDLTADCGIEPVVSQLYRLSYLKNLSWIHPQVCTKQELLRTLTSRPTDWKLPD